MVLTYDVSFYDMWQNLCRTGYWLIPIFGMWLILYLANACSWRIILKSSGPCTIPFFKLFKFTISAFALNYATPIGLMGGEPYKIMEIVPYVGKERATSSVLLFSMMHIFAHFWYWTTAILLYLIFIPVDMQISVVLLLMTVFCVAGIYLFTYGYKRGMVMKVMRLVASFPFLHHWGNQFISRHEQELKQIDQQIAALHQQDRQSFYKSFLLEYVGRLAHSFEIYFMLMLTGVQGTFLMLFLYSLLILAFTSLFANLLFFIPLQLGGREGGFAMSTLKVLGPVVGIKQSMTIAIFISIICRLREFFWMIIGLFLIKVNNRKAVENSKVTHFAILAAGEGSRLQQEGVEIPKPLIEVGGEKMIDRLIRIFLSNGAHDIVIITNDIYPEIQNHIRMLIDKGLPLRLVIKTTDSSMHSLYEVRDLLGDGTFCLTTVDTVFNENEFRDYINDVRIGEGLMAVTDYIDDEKPLYIDVDEHNLIRGYFDDKHGCRYISGGIYILNTKMLTTLERCVVEGQSRMRNFQRSLVEDGFKLRAFVFSKILDIDHADDIMKANEFISNL